MWITYFSFFFFIWGRRTNNNIRRGMVYGGTITWRRVGGNQKNKITQVQVYTAVVVVSTIQSLRSVNKLFAQKHILYILKKSSASLSRTQWKTEFNQNFRKLTEYGCVGRTASDRQHSLFYIFLAHIDRYSPILGYWADLYRQIGIPRSRNSNNSPAFENFQFSCVRNIEK